MKRLQDYSREKMNYFDESEDENKVHNFDWMRHHEILEQNDFKVLEFEVIE